MQKIMKIMCVVVSCLALVLSIVAIWFSLGTASTVKFEIGELNMSKSTTEYDYIDDTVSYDGTAKITCSDSKNAYLVVVHKELVSGGDSTSDYDKEYDVQVIIRDGEGEISTYDSGDVGNTMEPKYEFEIVGYTKLK